MIRIGIYDEDKAACQRTWQCVMEMKKNPDRSEERRVGKECRRRG